MSNLANFRVTHKWPAQNPDRLQLYSLPTPNGVKVSVMLEETGLPYEPHLVNFDTNDQSSPEFRSLNPYGKIPAILDPNGPGGRPLALFESGAILIYLADKTGMYLPRDPALRVRALGLEFPGPLGLAAGFDKDARATSGLGALGFGFVEVGTVTARAQPGNPRPRMFRLPADQALVNRMGFNNEGAAAAAARLRGRPGRRRTWPTTWWSTSARRTRPGCATCRPRTGSGRCWWRCARHSMLVLASGGVCRCW